MKTNHIVSYNTELTTGRRYNNRSLPIRIRSVSELDQIVACSRSIRTIFIRLRKSDVICAHLRNERPQVAADICKSLQSCLISRDKVVGNSTVIRFKKAVPIRLRFLDMTYLDCRRSQE